MGKHILLSCVHVPCGLWNGATRTPRRLCVSLEFVNECAAQRKPEIT